MEQTPLQKFASGMSVLLKVLEDYPDDLRKRVDWDEFAGVRELDSRTMGLRRF